MGKRIIQQRRGSGGPTYRARNNPKITTKPGYPSNAIGEYTVVKLIASPAHSVPIAKLVNKEGKTFFNFSSNLLHVGQNVKFGGAKAGDIAPLGELKNGTKVFNIEARPRDGGKFVRSGGTSAIISSRDEESVTLLFPSKKNKKLSILCRATVGIAAGDGRMDKPILKAGKQFFIKKAKSKLWPRTSAVKMNAIDHPFGSGRGKRMKSKIAKRNASPGKKVGLIRPRQTGRKKR
ncbi:MAG: large subunit ribosomal protein L2 [Patescibacteria group bacterium]|jgi:large subunit ribosomal protein L2